LLKEIRRMKEQKDKFYVILGELFIYMNFENLIKDANEGLRRKIYSRRDKTIVTVEEFDALSKKYFKGIKNNQNFKFNYQLRDKSILVFVLRWYYHIWIKVKDNSIELFCSFPKRFIIIKEVNKSNHIHTPKTFKVGTIMYFNSSAYSSCNWLKGVPLWDNRDEELELGLKPSCQINFSYISKL
jgi:hypothetical protein